MNVFMLLLTLAVFGFVVWLILKIPMPSVIQSIVIGVAILLIVLGLINLLWGVHTGIVIPVFR